VSAGTPDYDIWDKVDTFRLFEVAYLWAEEEPSSRTGHMGRKTRKIYSKLKQAIEKRQLSAKLSIEEAVNMATSEHSNWTRDNDDPVHVNLRVGRKALKEYAFSLNEKPKFLFPGRRP
jgi:hypothetical protein